MAKARKHLVIPDTQCRPGVPLEHLEWAGRYALEKRPDVIIQLGDHWDFPSLSSYESSTQKVAQSRDILSDIRAGNEGLRLFSFPIAAWNESKKSKTQRYLPRLILLRGNHDGETNGGRPHRAMEAEPWLQGFFEAHPMEAPGWKVVPFLKPFLADGIAYCHFFPRGPSGKVTQTRRGAPNARAQIMREGMSCTAGHLQGLDVAIMQSVKGPRRGVIAGSYYQHTEAYLGPQGNAHWRGILMKHEVQNGSYDLMEVSLDYLRRNYS